MTRFSQRLNLEVLEDRTLMSTCTVTRLGDANTGTGFRGTLRYCINKVNNNPGADVIKFNVTGTIQLIGALPTIFSDIDIQGPGVNLLTIQGAGFEGGFRILTIPSSYTVQVSKLTISNGYQPYGGGIFNQGTLTISDSRITGSRAFSGGGGIYNEGNLTLLASEVSNNSMQFNFPGISYGSGIHNVGQLTIIESAIVENDNSNESPFGTISNLNDLTVIRSTIADNEAWGYFDCRGGSGIYNVGTTSIYDTTISGNYGRDCEGVAIFGQFGFISVLNSTISTNTASWTPGIYVRDGTAVISYSTITKNHTQLTSVTGGGILLDSSAALFLGHSIVAGNSDWDIHGNLTFSQYNLIGNSSGASGFDATDILDVDPMLGPLADNGGPTFTHALLPGSPAIDAGDPNIVDPPEWDQRGPGFPRVVNGIIDIGSFEVQATGAPTAIDRLAVLITADFGTDDSEWRN